MLEHVILDFDGVVADTFDVGWALAQEHDETATIEDFLAHHDGNVHEAPRIKFLPERLPEFNAEYRRRVKPGHIDRAHDSIVRLGQKYSLYIISSNSEHGINEVLELAGVRHLFCKVMGVETHTSKVEKFRMLMRDHGVTAENSVFVTDTLGDIKEAHTVGIRAIAETFGFHDRDRLAQGNPFKVVDSWEEVERAIESLA